MGIIGLFNWIKNRSWGDLSERITFTEIPDDINFGHYLVDFNNVVHELRIDIESFTDDQKQILSEMTDEDKDNYVIELIILKTQAMYEKILPRFTFGLFMDGVVSMQKINLKREKAHTHHYKKYTMMNRTYVRSEEQTYNPLQGISHVNAGSPFMDKLEMKLRERFNGSNFFISGTREPGEGEHKIIDYIQGIHDDENILIGGNDSDLIVLSMLLEKKIYVCRSDENSEIDEDQKIYIDVNCLSRDIHRWVNSNIYNDVKKLEYNRFIRDFVLLTFFIGNDYIPGLKTKKYWGSMKTILKIYISVITSEKKTFYFVSYREKFLINTIFLKKFLNKIRIKERELLDQNSKKKLELIIPSDLSEEKLIAWKNEHILYNPLYRSYLTPINYLLDNWRDRYNILMFRDIDPGNICESYFQSLYFCFEMYFNRNINWSFFTRLYDCPLSNDLYDYLENIPNINNIHLPSSGSPVDIMVQKLLIIPRECFEYLPSQFSEILIDSEYDEYYPDCETLPKIIWEREEMKDINIILPRMNVDFFKNFYEENKHLIN